MTPTDIDPKPRYRHWVCLTDGLHDLSSEIGQWVARYRKGRRWWCGTQAPSEFQLISPQQARHRLGDECDLLVFDARNHLDSDAFGALSGTLVAGGTLLLLVDPLKQSGRFFRRLMRCLETPPNAGRDTPGVSLPLTDDADSMARSADQAVAIARLLRVALGHRRRPLVLTADRGRGKSVAMGIAAARLLQSKLNRILVTAPRRDAVFTLLGKAEQMLGDTATSSLRYVPPDKLARHPEEADLVLVDEAAAIPVAVLERLLRRYARIAFATTTHGYEGTGRGFSIRFKQVLDRVTPQWREYRLQAPIRWAPGDPLEWLTFAALLLDAEPVASASVQTATCDTCRFERLNRDHLLDDECLLRELFGLLVLAHYQTRPSDLQRLLDDPALSVWVARFDGHVVATALVVDEGDFEHDLAHDIAAGRRRPQGHLLPQTLAVHTGLAQAARLKYVRVMRIAVHPAVQRRGLGNALLANIRQTALAESIDVFGTSFGATDDLMRFWRNAGLTLVRVGLQRDAASGTHSAVWLAGLNACADAVLNELRDYFFDALPHLLVDELQDLEPDLVQAALLSAPVPARVERDRDECARYAQSERDYAGAVASLWRTVWSSGSSGDWNTLAKNRRDALVWRILQKRTWVDVAHQLNLPGKAQVEEILRDAVAILLSAR